MNLWLSKTLTTIKTYLWIAKEFIIENSVAFIFIGLCGVAALVAWLLF